MSVVVERRLRNHQLTESWFRTPEDLVTWLSAIQAQDYPAAKWAIGLRIKDITDEDVERAFNRGAILRTHFLRPTWHFVAPADIRWMLRLSASRVHAANAYYYRKFELDDRLFTRCRFLFERALRDGNDLTRTELASILRRAGIPADRLRLAYLMMHAELDGVICSGARRGNQFTYALLEERVPPGPVLERDHARAELTRRYFQGHGPATIRDFVWWSGLTVGDAKMGLEDVKSGLAEQRHDGRTYWSVESRDRHRTVPRSVHLLPNYDEFGIGYKDRDVVPSVPRPRRLSAGHEFAHLLLIDGQLAGRWRRTLNPGVIVVEVQPFRPLKRNEERAVEEETARYARFMNLAARISYV